MDWSSRSREQSSEQSQSRIQNYSPTLQHVSVGVVSHSEDVWRHFSTSLALVHVDHLVRVDGKATIRVDCNTEQPRVGLLGNRKREENIKLL